MKKRLYVAYGSNLNLKQMSYRCPTAKVYGKGKLKRYRFLFSGCKYNAFFTIVSIKNSEVPVVICEIIPS